MGGNESFKIEFAAVIVKTSLTTGVASFARIIFWDQSPY